MFSEMRRRAKKIGQPPGTSLYTGIHHDQPQITIIHYSEHDFHETHGTNLKECGGFPDETTGTTWINICGLSNISLIEEIATYYKLHPLTVEDILGVQQRPKIEEFDDYLFIVLKKLSWNKKKNTFATEQVSCVLGENFVLTFQESESSLFKNIYERIQSKSQQRLRQQKGDYLFYRCLDTIVDEYFVVLEGVGEQIEKIEEEIITAPTPKVSRRLYKLKRQMLNIRKSVWPMREVINHLSQANETFVTSFTRVYLRDLYDHTAQALDTIETFRDMLSGMLDVYLSSLTARMNEIMKVLTIISTIFIPITFVASVYGMNFLFMPELHLRYGYPAVLSVMLMIVITMLIYFRNKKWL
jgi:magnesium transporter